MIRNGIKKGESKSFSGYELLVFHVSFAHASMAKCFSNKMPLPSSCLIRRHALEFYR